MNKRILSIVLAAFICVLQFHLPASAANHASLIATYADGVVTVKGKDFSESTTYTVRVVDRADTSIKAMGQAVADGSGNISASVTTGALKLLGNYIVYINKSDGSLAGSSLINENIVTYPPTITPTPSAEISTAKDGDITFLTVVVTAEKDNAAGTAAAKIGADTVISMVNKAKEAEASGQKTVLEIKVKSTEVINSVDLKIPRDSFKQITDNTNSSIRVEGGIGTITFDPQAVASINNSATEDITISIKKVGNAALTEEARSKIGNRQVYDFSVKSGNRQISSFNGGKVEITIPYTPKDGEKENSIVVYAIDNAGKLVLVRGKYDSMSKMLKFTHNNFSQYAVGYNEMNFSDVETNAWYDEAIGFMSARGIINGVGGGRFNPENNVTRADFLIMVMNSYGIELDKSITDNFSDSGNAYYTKYLGTAKRLGLVTGMGNNRYAPEASISREDMFVILYNALKQLDELPADTIGKSLENFRDADDISGYAKDVLKLFVANGIVAGKGNKLAPKATAKRAEAAQLLYNMLSK